MEAAFTVARQFGVGNKEMASRVDEGSIKLFFVVSAFVTAICLWN